MGDQVLRCFREISDGPASRFCLSIGQLQLMHGLGLRDVGKYLPTVLLRWSRNAFIFVRTNLSDWLLNMLKTGIRNRSKNCTGMYLPDARLRIFRMSFDKSRLWPSTILLWNWGSRCRRCYRNESEAVFAGYCLHVSYMRASISRHIGNYMFRLEITCYEILLNR